MPAPQLPHGTRAYRLSSNRVHPSLHTLVGQPNTCVDRMIGEGGLPRVPEPLDLGIALALERGRGDESFVEDLTIDHPGRHAMFIVRLDGEVVTVTNTFDAAALYAEGIRGVGHRVAIKIGRASCRERV